MWARPSPDETIPVIRIDGPSGLLLMTVCNGAKQHVEQPLGIAMAGDLSWMEERYAQLEEQSLLWQPPTLESANTPRCTMDGKPTIMLSANNYLNLTTHPKVVDAAIEATRKYGAGSGSVRAIAGTMDIHLEAENKVAEFVEAGGKRPDDQEMTCNMVKKRYYLHVTLELEMFIKI